MATNDFNGDGRPDMVVATTADASISVLLSSGATGYAPHVDYPLPASPTSLVVADFDIDGIPDFAVTVWNSPQLLTFSGRDGGSFIAGPSASVYPGSQELVVGDFNNDSRPDLVARSYGNPITILLGSDGGFLPARGVDAGARSYTTAGATDFDADGNHDVLLARTFGFDSSDLQILYGDGTGNFTSSAPLIRESLYFLRIADFNGDGRPDILGVKDQGAAGSSVVVMLNRGGRSFERATETAAMSNPNDVAVGELNADGKPDVVLTFRNRSGVGVLINRGDASFFPPVLSAHFEALSPVVADFTGDSVPDVAVSNSTHASLSILPNLGDGRLIAPRFYDDGLLFHWSGSSLTDLDGDGTLDLVDLVSDRPAKMLAIRYNRGNGLFGPATLLPAPLSASSVVAIDVDDDDHRDLVTSDLAGSLSIFTNGGDSGFLPFTSIDAGFAAQQLETADFDGDQRPDLVAGGSFRLGAFLNAGGSFTAPVAPVVSPTSFSQLKTGDFNGDGLQDVAALEGLNALKVFNNAGGGRFVPSGVSLMSGAHVASGDFDGDGAPDLAVDANGGVRVYLNARDGGFVPTPLIAFSPGWVDEFAAADLNGDGRADLVIAVHGVSNTPKQLMLLISDPSGAFASRASFPVSLDWSSLDLGDLDGDGRLDVALTASMGTQVFLNLCLP